MTSPSISSIINTLKELVNGVIPVLELVAVVVFLWGVIKFIRAGGNEQEIKEAKGYIIYGLIGMFVLISFWGIMNLLAATFGITPGGNIPIPQFQ